MCRPKDLTTTLNGYLFLKPSLFKGILPDIIEEFLKTRIKIKECIKFFGDN